MSQAAILSARDLRVELRSRRGSFVLTAAALDLCARETLVILGPNGSGKSTLAFVLAGRDGYEVTRGEIIYRGSDLFDLAPEERAGEGISQDAIDKLFA